jgi:hypothetical protein
MIKAAPLSDEPDLPISLGGEVNQLSRRGEHWIYVVKLLRAHGGCLGVRRL